MRISRTIKHYHRIILEGDFFLKLNFLKIFKRKEETDLECIKNIPNMYDEIAERIFDFFTDNCEEKLSTQFILKNGRSVLVSFDMELVHMPRSAYIDIYDRQDERVAFIHIYEICAMARVPKGGRVGLK